MTAVLAFALTACGTSRTSTVSGGDITLKLIATDYGDRTGNPAQQYWDQLVGEFEFRNPGIHIDVDVHPASEVDRKVASLVKAGNAPDIAQTGTYADYASADKLYQVDELLSIPTQASFVPSLAEAGRVRRIQYGMPFTAGTRVLFYNKKLLAKAGIPRPPQTWDQLRDDAAALKESGVQWPYGLPLGPEESEAEALNWMLSAGGGFTNAAGGYAFDSSENIKAFEWLRDELVGEGLTNPAPGTFNRQEAYDAFTAGNLAMLNGHPALMQSARESGIDFGVAPMPGRREASPSVTGTAGWMMAFKQHDHRREIGTFLDFVYSKDNALMFADRYNMLPVTIDAVDDLHADRTKKALWPFLDELEAAEFYPVGKTSWTSAKAGLRRVIGTTVRKDGDPAKVLSQLQREAESLQSAGS
jgi:multiple sugar transport system substrate-binding protein